MGFLTQNSGNIANLCIGTAAVALGNLTGLKEAAIGAAGLIDFVHKQNAKFGPECARVRGRIQQQVMTGYGHLLTGSDGHADARIELEAADKALSQHLGVCIIDRATLAAYAVTPQGFLEPAVQMVMQGLAQKAPELFVANSLAHRFASDVLRAGLSAAIENTDYYRRLEPHLMLAMAQGIGGIDKKLDAVAATVDSLDTKIDAFLQTMQRQAGHRLDDTAISDLRALLAAILGQGISDEQIPAALIAAKQSLDKSRAELENLRGLANQAPEIEPHLAAARAALDNQGSVDLAAAQNAICTARQKYAAAIKARQAIEAVNMARLLEAEADLALARSDYLGAAELLAQAANGLPAGDTVLRAGLLTWHGNALALHGERFPASDSLMRALASYKKALEIYTEKNMGADWAATQSNLGNVFAMLGAKLGGAVGREYLEKAVIAQNAALTIQNRETTPNDWARIQHNLGNVLQAIGAMLAGDAGRLSLERSVQAYMQALTVRDQATMSVEWAATQNGLGNALSRLGSDGNGQYLAQAVQAYKAALTVYKLTTTPADWAMTQNNLGRRLITLHTRFGWQRV